jgi:hypothetical protein
VTQSAGYSTEQVAAAATQAKAFGDAWAGIRYTTALDVTTTYWYSVRRD